MSEVIKIKKGLDIPLKGKAEKAVAQLSLSQTFAVKPTDFAGLMPKLDVKLGDYVKAGTPLFSDKYAPEVKFASPVSGIVEAINRGDRRKLLEIVVKADNEQSYEPFAQGKPSSMSAGDIISAMQASGTWVLLTSRPFGVIAKSADKPKAIFVTGFDSAPLAPDYEFAAKEDANYFQTGIDALKKLTEGTVHLGLRPGSGSVFAKASGTKVTYYDGPHPAGLAGTQINKISPINKGETVWTISALDVIIIGKLFELGRYDATRTIAVAGPATVKPQYVRVLPGAPIKDVIAGISAAGQIRIIDGNPLTGNALAPDGYLGYKPSQVSLLEEGYKMEFMGWGAPGLHKFSMSRAFFSWLSPGKEYALNTNTNGGERPFVVTGQYEKVFPLDVLPVPLLKSIIIDDIDKMEQLGIYEVLEEDFALCEYVCTSKIEAQSIIRNGLDNLYKELS
jgi:Na+-transporting NADH:ubiquinone oxidoreductase subunit A